MKFSSKTPPRKFRAGTTIELSDCGDLHLGPDEQISFVTESGGKYDVARKSWGFYATPSLNHRLVNEGFRACLVRNTQDRIYVMLVEKDKLQDFESYLKGYGNEVLVWLDSPDIESLFPGTRK